MAVPIVFDGTRYNSGTVSSGGGFGPSYTVPPFSTIAGDYIVYGSIYNPGDSVIVIEEYGPSARFTYTFCATQYDSPDAIVLQSRFGRTYLFSNTPVTSGQQFNFTEESLGDYTPAPVCFGTGTKICTERGEVAVEDLQVGDMAVTASGPLRPITWIGHRKIKAESGFLAFNQQPVRVQAAAFGNGLPSRDLFLSPGHPVLVGADVDNDGGVLVPVLCLINGTTITREPVATVTYWHVELDAHDILLAEGLPAESYIDGGDRAFFSEASDHALHNPDFVVPGWDSRCRPVAVDGPLVEAERLRLDAVFAGSLSAQCDWEPSSPAISQW